jgi:hypothetical protein
MNNNVKEAIQNVITTMMDKVMNRVLIEDPFIVEEHRAKKPLYAALVPDEIFKGSHFERRFVTPFGKVWEKLAQVVGEVKYGSALRNHSITGNIPSERLRRLNEIINKLEHSTKGTKKIKPNWQEEIKYILAGKGNLIPTSIVCDIFIENVKNQKKYTFELKAPLPNSDQTKVSKEKIFKLFSMSPCPIDVAFFALPYNPYGKREDYSWEFPERWFNMRQSPVVLIGNEFWDFIGGKGTYKNFIDVINNLGKEYKIRIYKEFLGIEPPYKEEIEF